MRALNPRERRLTAIGLLVLAVAVGWLAVVGPLVGGFQARAEERKSLQSAFERNQRLIASLPTVRAAVEAQRAGAARFTVLAASDTLATEALKERLQRLASEGGFQVTSIEDLQAEAPPGVVKIRADLTLTLTQWRQALRRLESEDAYVVVDYLSISADRALATGRPEPLDVRLEISADWRQPGSRA